MLRKRCVAPVKWYCLQCVMLALPLVLVNFCPSQVKRIQSVPLVIGQFLEAIDQNYAIVGSTTG